MSSNNELSERAMNSTRGCLRTDEIWNARMVAEMLAGDAPGGLKSHIDDDSAGMAILFSRI